jgi:ABC-type uncharacterized transport system involved in gliding motility auxiliary subunit
MSGPAVGLRARFRAWWARLRDAGGPGADRRRWAPAGYLAAVVVLLVLGGYYVVYRRFDLYAQIGLAVAFFAALAAILLDPGLVRRALTGRQARYGGNALVISLAFLGILVIVNSLAYANPVRADLTEDRDYSLTPETQLAVAQLQSPVEIIGFYSSEMRSSQETIRTLLDSYRISSDRLISYRFIDTYGDPVSVSQFGVTRDGSIVVAIGGASEVIPFPSEQEITSAIIRLANPEDRKVYFLTGHGERDIEDTGETGFSQVRDALVAKNYEVAALNLLVDPQIPDDALAVIIAGPMLPLSPEEVDLLGGYLEAGGALVLLQQPRAETRFEDAADPLEGYLAQSWGITLADDLVIEPRSQNFLNAIAFSYADHPITSRMQNIAAVFPAARSITVAPAESPTLTQTALAFSSEYSWGEIDLGFLDSQTLPEWAEGAETPGPLTLAAVAEETASGSRVAVIGDVDFGTNRFFFQLGNGDLLVNSIDWATGQENLISLTPRPATQRFVVPPSSEVLALIILTTVVLMPGAVVVLGVWTGWQRRRRV